MTDTSREAVEALAKTADECELQCSDPIGATLRALLDERDVAVAAALEEAAELARGHEKRIRSALEPVTPDMLAQARADGMREAAEMFHEEQVQIWSQEILEGLAMADLFTPSTYDDKIDAHRIVQRELTDIAATILAAIEKGEG